MGGIGLEHSENNLSEVSENKELNGTFCHAPETATVLKTAHILQKHPELVQIIEEWEHLSLEVRQQIVKITESQE